MTEYQFVDEDGQVIKAPREKMPLGLDDNPQVNISGGLVEISSQVERLYAAEPMMPQRDNLEVTNMPQAPGRNGIATIEMTPLALGAPDPVMPPDPIATARQQRRHDAAQQVPQDQPQAPRQRVPTQPVPAAQGGRPRPASRPAGSEEDGGFDTALERIGEAKEKIRSTLPGRGIRPNRPRVIRKMRDKIGRL